MQLEGRRSNPKIDEKLKEYESGDKTLNAILIELGYVKSKKQHFLNRLDNAAKRSKKAKRLKRDYEMNFITRKETEKKLKQMNM